MIHLSYLQIAILVLVVFSITSMFGFVAGENYERNRGKPVRKLYPKSSSTPESD